ncbi:FtsK/SpoIIIE family protein, partial [Streptomyces harbinensis]
MTGAGLALIGYAMTTWADAPELRAPLLGAAAAVAITGALLGAWHERRARPVRDLTAALAPVLQPSDPAGMVRARKRVKSIPTLIKITYPPTFDDRDDKARSKVRDIVATRLGGSVEATWDRRRRLITCRVDLGHDVLIESDTTGDTEGPTEAPARAVLRQRTTSVVHAIMGATASDVADIEFSDSDTMRRIEVKYQTTTKDLSRAFRQRVLMQMDAKLPGEWRDIWDFENDRVSFIPRPPFPSNVFYPASHQPKDLEIPYAVTENREIVSWKLGAKDPHCLVVGPTGSGKTVYIRNLVVGARLLGIPVVLCDPKRTEFLDFRGMPGVTVITDVEEIADALVATGAEMHRRNGEIEAGHARKGDHSKVLLVVDEFFVFKEGIADAWAARRAMNKTIKAKEHPCMSQFRQLVVLARSAGIHLCVGIQRPDAEFLTGLARDSFRKRVSLDRTTGQAAQMMWDDARVGRDLPSIHGRAMSSTATGPEEVQVFRLLTEADVDAYTDDDRAVWEALTSRITSAGSDSLSYLGNLGTRTAPPRPANTAAAAPPAIEHHQEEDT